MRLEPWGLFEMGKTPLGPIICKKSNVLGKNGPLAGKSKAARRLQRWMKNITVMKAIISTASPVSLEYSMAESPKGRPFP